MHASGTWLWCYLASCRTRIHLIPNAIKWYPWAYYLFVCTWLNQKDPFSLSYHGSRIYRWVWWSAIPHSGGYARILVECWLEAFERVVCTGCRGILWEPHDSDYLGKLWHKRLGHLHSRALPIWKDMCKDGRTSRLGRKKCARVLGKHVKVSFPSSEA